MKKQMKKGHIVRYDKEADVLALYLREGAEEEFEEIIPGVSVEFNKEGSVIGFEILNASKVLRPALKAIEKYKSAVYART